MDVIFVYLTIAIALFLAAFFARRRFGLLGLALAAGWLLSDIWGYNIGLIAGGIGIAQTPLSTAIVLSITVLLPAGVLMFHGHVYKNLIGRVVGAALFTVLAIAFLIEPIGHVLTPTGNSADIYNWLVENNSSIIAIGMGAAVLDVFFTKPADLTGRRSKR